MKLLYFVIQITWGSIQSLLGFIVFIFNINKKHLFYHGAIITYWPFSSSVSLGLFIFITEEPYFYEKLKNDYSKDELASRLLVHEYGHTIQSLILGPMYLIIMGIPSTIWVFLPNLHKKRKEEKISYFTFFTEKWANKLGEQLLKKKSMEYLLID